MNKITNFILLALLTASIVGITSCQKTAVTTEEETENNFIIPINKDIVIDDITFEALYDSCELWNTNGGQNVIMEEGAVIFNNSTTADSINYVFNSDDAIYYNPIETGIEELKSNKEVPQNSVNIEINTTVSSTQQYVAFVDNLEIANITGNVTVTFELSAAEENLFVNNGITITTTETLTNMLFNDNANPVNDDVIAYYENYFTEENKPYILSTPENPQDFTILDLEELVDRTDWIENEDTIPVFTNGNVYTNYMDSGNPYANNNAIIATNENKDFFTESLFLSADGQDTLLNQRLK